MVAVAAEIKAAEVAAGPWGQGPWGQGGGQQPDLEDILKRGQDRLKQVIPGGGGGIPGR